MCEILLNNCDFPVFLEKKPPCTRIFDVVSSVEIVQKSVAVRLVYETNNEGGATEEMYASLLKVSFD